MAFTMILECSRRWQLKKPFQLSTTTWFSFKSTDSSWILIKSSFAISKSQITRLVSVGKGNVTWVLMYKVSPRCDEFETWESNKSPCSPPPNRNHTVRLARRLHFRILIVAVLWILIEFSQQCSFWRNNRGSTAHEACPWSRLIKHMTQQSECDSKRHISANNVVVRYMTTIKNSQVGRHISMVIWLCTFPGLT